jgi:hypothetical protein
MKEDTDAHSDKSRVVISNTQIIHSTGQDTEQLLPLSCSSPPSIDALATNPAGDSHGQHGRTAATSTSTAGAAGAAAADVHGVPTAVKPSAAGTAAIEQLRPPSSPVPALQDDSKGCCTVAGQLPATAALSKAKAAATRTATQRPDTSSPSDTQAVHASSTQNSRRGTQELQTPISMLPTACSDPASGCSNFTLVAHLQEYSALQVAGALQWLLGLQSDPYSTIPEFSIVSVLLAPAGLLSAAQAGPPLPDQGAVLLLAARPSGRVRADEMLAELDSYLHEAIPATGASSTERPPQLGVQSVAGWELFSAASKAASKSNASTLAALGKQKQQLLLTMAKGAGALADSEVLAACIMRMARTGLHLLGLQTVYLDAQQCHFVNRGSQLHPECGSASILLVAAGAASAVLNWKAELGPTGVVAAVTDPHSLHAQLKDHDAIFTASYDASAALKELDLLFPGSAGPAGGSERMDQQKPGSLLLPPPAEESAWLQLGAGSVDDLVQALHTVQFCCAAGCTVDRLGRAALPGCITDGTDTAPQLLVHLASPGCRTMLEAISSRLQQECPADPHAHEPQLVIVDPASSDADELKRSCSGPVAYQDPGELNDAQSELLSAQLPAAGKVDLVAIAVHSSVAGAAAGCLGSLLAQAQAHCPLLQVLGVRQQQQLFAPAQQLLDIFATPSTNSAAPTHGGCKHVKGPLLLAVAAAVDLQQFGAGSAASAGWRAACGPATDMAFLESAFDFGVADDTDCVVGVSRDHSGAEELLWRCFQEGQVVVDRSVCDGGLLPAAASAPTWEDIRLKISELNRPMPTICMLQREALVHNHLERILALLTKDSFVVEQAATALLTPGLAATMGSPGAQGQAVILLCLSRPNAVQRLQHLLSAPGE